MNKMIDISIAVDPEVAAALGSARDREAVGRLVSRARSGALIDRFWFDPVTRFTDCRDAKDNKYLELADAAGAEIIVSFDEDLLVLHPWRGVQILSAEAQ